MRLFAGLLGVRRESERKGFVDAQLSDLTVVCASPRGYTLKARDLLALHEIVGYGVFTKFLEFADLLLNTFLSLIASIQEFAELQ